MTGTITRAGGLLNSRACQVDNDQVFHECGPGWKSLIDPIVTRANDMGATITQIKEKFGLLRIYFDPGHADCDELEDMVDQAELDSATRCEMCGEPAHMMLKAGWRKTLCKIHAIDLGYKEKA